MLRCHSPDIGNRFNSNPDDRRPWKVFLMDEKERDSLIEFIAVSVLVTVIAVVLIVVLLNWWYV